MHEDVVGAGVGAAEAGEVREEAREGEEVAAEEQRVEEGVEGAEGGGGDGEEGADSARREAGAGVAGDDVAEEGLGGREARLGVEVVEELFHLGEHFGLGEFGDDDVVGAEGAAEGARRGVVRVWVEEELEGGGGVFLGAEEGGESEGGYGFRSGHSCLCHKSIFTVSIINLTFLR